VLAGQAVFESPELGALTQPCLSPRPCPVATRTLQAANFGSLFGAIKPRRDSRLPTLRDPLPASGLRAIGTLWQRLPRGVRARKRTTWPCAKCRVTSDTSTNLWTRPYGQQTLLSHPSASRTHRLCRTCFSRESETSAWNPTCSGFRWLYGASSMSSDSTLGLFGVHEFSGTHRALRSSRDFETRIPSGIHRTPRGFTVPRGPP
jgi:hypothetical protein